MVTQSHLIETLNRLGYPMTERRLTDWRQKGLLPKFRQKGRQHHGKVYYWDEPDVIAQAITVCELFEQYSRADWVFLSTWFAGYPLSVKKVRELWLEQLESEQARVREDVNDEDDLQDKFDRMVRTANRQRKASAYPTLSWETLMFGLNVFLNANDGFEDYLGDQLGTELNRVLRQNPKFKNIPSLDLQQVEPIARFLQDHWSLDARCELISSVTDQTLEQAHRDWRMVMLLLRGLSRLSTPGLAKTFRQFVPLQAMLGGWVITADSILRNLGYGRRIENVLMEVLDFTSRVSMDGELQRVFEDPNAYANAHFVALRERVVAI